MWRWQILSSFLLTHATTRLFCNSCCFVFKSASPTLHSILDLLGESRHIYSGARPFPPCHRHLCFSLLTHTHHHSDILPNSLSCITIMYSDDESYNGPTMDYEEYDGSRPFSEYKIDYTLVSITISEAMKPNSSHADALEPRYIRLCAVLHHHRPHSGIIDVECSHGSTKT